MHGDGQRNIKGYKEQYLVERHYEHICNKRKKNQGRNILGISRSKTSQDAEQEETRKHVVCVVTYIQTVKLRETNNR